MQTRFLNRKYSSSGQGILEYAVLLAVVITVFVIMQFYVKRGYMGRMKQEADSVSAQYSPKHTVSSITTASAINSVSYSGGVTNSSDSAGSAAGIIPDKVTIPEGVSVSYSKSVATVNKNETVTVTKK